MSAPTLSILSYNIRRSPDVWTLLSNHTLLRTLDILLLQEPPPLAVVPPDWVRLDSPPGRRARSVALVRQKWAQSSYAQVAVASSDVVALDLRTGTAGEASVRVIGVYNPHQGDPEPTERGKSAREVLPPILESTPPGSLLVVAGDFNLHHPEWDPEYAPRGGVCADAEQAQLTFAQHGLVHLLAPSTPTYKYPPRAGGDDRWATLDLVLGDLRVEARMVSCGIDERLDCFSDHQPLRLTLALDPPAPAHQPRRLFRRMQPEMLRDELAARLGTAPPPLATREDIDAEAVRLTEALSGAIESGAVPLSKPRRDGRPAHAWWSDEISALHEDARRRERRAHRMRRAGDETAATAGLEAKVAKSRLKAVIRREKRRHEKSEFDEVTDKTLWATVKRVEGRGASASTPPLKRGDGTHASSPQDKLALLQPVLLPEVERAADARAAPAAAAAEVEVAVEVEFEWPTLQEHEVRSALLDARPYAAVGPDGIPNVVLQTAWDILAPHLVPLYAASLAVGHLPKSWRDGTGVVLRKPKKPDYSETRAYRLIAFGRCVSKLLEAVVARRLSYMGERGLWPVEHVGGRRGRSAEDAVICFVDEIKRQQRHGNVVVGVALDVAKAFPSVRTDILLDDLRKGGVPFAARSWIESFMSGRTCTLVLEGVSSEPVEWRSGLPQGSPLSPALFLTYNADLLRACRSTTTMATGWIDDINLLGWGKSVSSAVDALNARMRHLEKWSQTHQSGFEATKTTAVVFRPRRGTAGATTAAAAAAEAPPIVLDGVELAYADEMTMLGARIDAELTFEAHRRTCASRGAQAAGAIGLLARARVGLSARHTRTLVRACVYPRMLWMAGAWWEKSGSVKAFESVQRTCSRLVTGGYSLSALAALEVEAALPPVDLLLDAAVHRVGLRALSAAHARVARARAHLPHQRHLRSPLHRALHGFPDTLPRTLVLETLLPEPVAPWEADPLPPAVVAENKDKAKETHLALLADLGPHDLVGYSDGSLIDGRAGAGWALRAVFDGEELWQERSAALGGQHTVYRGELEGMRMLLAKMTTLTPPLHPFTLHLCLDNQAAALHPSSPRPTSGQPARLEIRRLAHELKETHPLMTIVVSWVPGHADVEGNERADARAKGGAEVGEVDKAARAGGRGGARRRSMVMPRAALERSVEPSDDERDEWFEGERETSPQAESNQPPRPALPDLIGAPDGLEDLRGEPKSVAAVRQDFRAAQQAAWAARWATARGAGLRLVTGKVAPGAAFVRYHATLSRRQSTLLARLRLDFAGLAAHLHRIQRHPTGLCECGEEETRAHFLLACPLYAAPRAALVRATGKDDLPPLATLLSDLDLARPVLRFVNDTGRFPRLHEAVKDAATTVKQGV